MKNLFALLSAMVIAPVFAAEAVPAQPAPTPAATTATTQAPAPAKPAGTVARAQFTSAVQDREPTDKLTTLGTDQTRISFFTELKGLANQKVTHRWEHGGKVMSEVSFDVGGDRWRVFSSKTLDPSWTGEWKVSVVDETGGTLGASTFTYDVPKAAAPAPAQPASAATPAAPAAAAQPATPTTSPAGAAPRK